MSFPFPAINVDVGIGDTIRAIDEILSRSREGSLKKQDEMLVRLRQQLEIILSIVTKLEELFIELLRAYRDEEILKNPDALKSLIDQTSIFLESRKLLKHLEPAIGDVEAAAVSPRFGESKDYDEMVAGLHRLHEKLQVYRKALGAGGNTGPGILQLQNLRFLSRQHLDTLDPLIPKIAEVAQQAFDEHDWQLTSDIRKLIGIVRMNT